MAQIDEIKAKIKALRAETEANSITPDSLGQSGVKNPFVGPTE